MRNCSVFQFDANTIHIEVGRFREGRDHLDKFQSETW